MKTRLQLVLTLCLMMVGGNVFAGDIIGGKDNVTYYNVNYELDIDGQIVYRRNERTPEGQLLSATVKEVYSPTDRETWPKCIKDDPNWIFEGYTKDAAQPGESLNRGSEEIGNVTGNGLTFHVYAVFSKTERKYRLQTETINSNGSFLIVAKANNKYYALKNSNNNSATVEGVELTNDRFDDLGTINPTGLPANIIWSFAQNGNNTNRGTLSNGNYRVYLNNSHLLNNQNQTLRFTNESNGRWTIYYYEDVWFGTDVYNYLKFSGSNFSYSNSNSNLGEIYIYRLQEVSTYLQQCATFDVLFEPGNNGIMSDPTEYVVTRRSSLKFPADPVNCPDGWNFAGWSKNIYPVETTNPDPALGTLINSTNNPTYYSTGFTPTKDTTFYAVYEHKYGGLWTMNPPCNDYNVKYYVTKEDASPTSITYKDAVRLSTTNHPSDPCTRWHFVGWKMGSACEDNATTQPENLINPTTYSTYYTAWFKPATNETNLYAVYQHITNGSPDDIWTSNPDCNPYTVTLDAGNGHITNSSGPQTTTRTEASVGGGIALSGTTCVSNCDPNWTWKGWIYGAPCNTDVNPTTNSNPNFYSPTSTFYPHANGEVLYAIYVNSNNSYWTTNPMCEDAKVTFDLGGGSWNGTVTNPVVSTGGTPITLYGSDKVTPPCTNMYQFVGWFNDAYDNTTAPQYAPSPYIPTKAEETLHAVYKRVGYEYYTTTPKCDIDVTFNTYGASYSTTVTDNKMTSVNGAAITLPGVTDPCARWHFVGWSKNKCISTTIDPTSSLLSSPYTPMKDEVLHAVYRHKINSNYDNLWSSEFDCKPYTITFNLGDGTWADNASRDPRDLAEEVAGNGVVLFSDEDVRPDCYSNASGAWRFVGWTIGEKYPETVIAGNQSLASLGILEEGDTFVPQQDGLIMYAVYRQQDGRNYRYSTNPHCNSYTVYFNACAGTAVSELTEIVKGNGITLPTATINCSGWALAGWAYSPVNVQTNIEPDGLLTPGATFYPSENFITLYAVYRNPENSTYSLITTLDQITSGDNYLIVYNDNGTYRAMDNVIIEPFRKSGQGNNQRTGPVLNTTNVNVNNNIISLNNPQLNWKFTKNNDKYAIYNASARKYLDIDEEIAGRQSIFLRDYPNNNYTITSANNGFSIMSNTTSSNNKYLYYETIRRGSNAGYYYAFRSNNTAQTLYLYKENSASDYYSYPCVTMADAVHWGEGTMTVESHSYTGTPSYNNAAGTANGDGTYNINLSSANPCSQITIRWNNQNYNVIVPYIVGSITPQALRDQTDCSTCDVVVLNGATYNLNSSKEFRNVTVYEGGTLNIANGATLKAQSLILRMDGDALHFNQAPLIKFMGENAKIDAKNVYQDRRIGYDRYYWVSFADSTKVSDIRYAHNLIPDNNTEPVYRTDFFVKYYNGVQRAADSNSGNLSSTYWTHVANRGADYTMQPGRGYVVGIKDLVNDRKLTLRFKMLTDGPLSLEQNKVIDVEPSTATRKQDAGWNLISNPYMYEYYTGAVGASSGFVNGAWMEELDKNGNWTGRWIADTTRNANIPYVTFYGIDNSGKEYYVQGHADDRTIYPYDPFFVQVETYDQIQFGSPMSAHNMRALFRAEEVKNEPINTGIMLVDFSNHDLLDNTGLVISNDYTDEYEIGGDLLKMKSTGRINLYSLNNENTELAFNALSVASAANIIPLGVVLPKSGEYVFAFDAEQYDPEAIQQLMLTDYHLNETVDLMQTDYKFMANAGTNNTRFALTVVINPEYTHVITDNPDTGKDGAYCYETYDGLVVNNILQESDIRVYDVLGKQIYFVQNAKGKHHFQLGTGAYNIVLTAGGKRTTLRGIVK